MMEQPKEVKVRVRSINDGSTWEESFKSYGNPKQEFTILIKKWNDDYPNNKRELVEIIGDSGIIYCVWQKMNMLTVLKNRENYDIMGCTRCGIIEKRHGFGEGFNYNRECKPELVCTECNKQFKSIVGLNKHNDTGKHKTPEWLPDGV